MVAWVLDALVPSPEAMILLSDYIDQNYIGVINVPAYCLDAVRTNWASFYSVLYKPAHERGTGDCRCLVLRSIAVYWQHSYPKRRPPCPPGPQ